MNGRADDDFMRAWLIVVVSCFMCPTTSLNVSARCYPIVVDLERVKRLNFCSFTANQIRASLGGKRRKKAVNCCVHHMVVLYVDSLVVDIQVPNCIVRAEAWDSKLIGQVAKADRKPEGGYGKLSMKPRFRSNRGGGLFVGYEDTEKFVSSKLPSTYNRSKKRKIAAMLTTLCSELSESLGSFVEGIGKLDMNDAGSSRCNLHKRKRPKAAGDHVTRAEESEHDGGISEDDAEYLPSSESGRDGEASSSDDSSDAFVSPRSAIPKQNNLRQNSMASRGRGNVKMKEMTASKVETDRECTKPGKYPEGHTNLAGKLSKVGHTHTSVHGEQGHTIGNPHEQRQNGQKITMIGDTIPSGSGGNHITIHDVTPISSAPPIVHFVHQGAAQCTPSPANSIPDMVASNEQKATFQTVRSATPIAADNMIRGGEHGANHTSASTKSCPAPSNQKRRGTPTRVQSTMAQATQGAMHMIWEKLHLGPLAQQQAAQRAQAASPQMSSTPSIYTHHQSARNNECPSFDLNLSFHEHEGINRELPTPLNPRNLDAYMSESGDDWGLDPEELQKVCYEAEAQFAKKKEKERLEMEERLGNKGQGNNQDASTPTIEPVTAAAADVASSSRTPAAVGHERRVVRAPAQLRSPFIDPENADPFYCSKQVCDIYDAVCQFGGGGAPTTRSKAVQIGNSKPIINYDEFFIDCSELANSMAPGRKMDSIVAEIAIIALRESGPKPKKRIMPLRITTFFQNNNFIRNDIDKHFDNKTRRLSRCESVSFPTLEILDKENPKESGHYWLLVLNIRDKRFEVLDSARPLKDKALLATANKIIEGIKANWERHYENSSVQIKDWELQEIKCPKQDNRYDCSIYMFYNTENWDGRLVLEYGQKDILNIRKQLTAKMVKSSHNDINWARMLKINKKQGARQ